MTRAAARRVRPRRGRGRQSAGKNRRQAGIGCTGNAGGRRATRRARHALAHFQYPPFPRSAGKNWRRAKPAARRDRPHGERGRRSAGKNRRQAGIGLRSGCGRRARIGLRWKCGCARRVTAARGVRPRRAGISLEAAQWSDNPGKQMVWVRPKQRRRAGRPPPSAKHARRVLPRARRHTCRCCRALRPPSRQRALKKYMPQPMVRAHIK